MRTAKIDGTTLALTGDLNATTPVEILGGTPISLSKLTFNNHDIAFTTTTSGTISAELDYPRPKLALPQLNQLNWKYIDSLPELDPTYNDTAWTPATLPRTPNSKRPLTTPTSLYASDYGFHTGTLLYRGVFTASGNESTFSITTQGGSAFGSSIYLNAELLGSWRGFDAAASGMSTFTLPPLTPGKKYIITVVIDNQGLDQNWTIGTETMKNPRGILNFTLAGRPQDAVSWKLTGNRGGEEYADRSRGPLNEGGLWAERRGLHLPGALDAEDAGWRPSRGPVVDGIDEAGISTLR